MSSWIYSLLVPAVAAWCAACIKRREWCWAAASGAMLMTLIPLCVVSTIRGWS